MKQTLRHAGKSDIGRVRKENQDRWFADDEQGLYIVADGVGGGHAGGLAAQIVADTLPLIVSRQMSGAVDLSSDDARDQLRDALVTLSDRLRDEASGQVGLDGMASTVVLALVRGDQALVAHMGDSRAYLLRGDKLRGLTSDHSLTQLLVTAGEISSEAAETHPSRGQLTRYVGMEGEPIPDMNSMRFEPEDRLLLCTDGLTNGVTEAGITRCIANRNLARACQDLVRRANLAGGEDNTTVVLIERNS